MIFTCTFAVIYMQQPPHAVDCRQLFNFGTIFTTNITQSTQESGSLLCKSEEFFPILFLLKKRAESS